jgi:lactate dehydrogenase-like 2-hydroxyacid dehydrogenase
MKPKVFVTRPLPSPALDLLAEQFELAFHPQDSPIPPEKLAEACRDIEGLVVAGTRVAAEIISAALKLRAISTASVGYDNIDVAACTARGIPVTNTVGVLEDTTADLAFALLLAVARRVVEGDRFVRDGRWREWQWGLLHAADVHHKTLGLFGFGRIGQAVARRGRGFSMRIIYYARHRVAGAVEREFDAQYVDRETLLRQSDFLSLHIPKTPDTQHTIGARELGLMKPSAFLINTARGSVVDEPALVYALEAKTIAGAGLDVFEQEPKVHPSLISMPNVVLMPHVGSATGETRLKMAMRAAENLIALLGGRRPADVVNSEVFKT